jgi:predicted ATPase
VRVLWGTCHHEQGRPPYWPIVEALRAYIQDCTAAKLQAEMGTLAADITYMVPELRHRLPSLPQAPPLHDPDAARFRCFDSVAQFLQLASASQPILLVLEDIHWADRLSLLFLEFLAHELARARMLVVCSYRDTELQPRDPLTQALGEISRHGVLARIALQGLSEGDIRAYVEVAAGHTPPEGLVHALRDHTEGNPLFVAETVRHLVLLR